MTVNMIQTAVMDIMVAEADDHEDHPDDKDDAPHKGAKQKDFLNRA
jgi:hypothetical protein